MSEQAITTDQLTQKLNIDKLVDKFLAWELPKSVCSDGCVTTRDYPYSRTGTNLLTADEAKQMLEYLLADQQGEKV